jgi:hypothetical protein
MNTINFFGYGLLRDRSIIKEIIGRDPGTGRPAIIRGYELVYQVLSQIPEKVRQKLEQAWGSNFKAYTLRRGAGIVTGVIWEITDQELEKIKAWEFVGMWREAVNDTVTTSDGEQISIAIIKAPDEQLFEEKINGLQYETNLNRKRPVPDESKEEDAELMASVRRQLEELAAQGAYGTQSFA